MARQPQWAWPGLLYEVRRSHSVKTRTHSVVTLWTISPSQRPLPDKTQHSQQTGRHLCPRRDSNPQSQQASGSRPTP